VRESVHRTVETTQGVFQREEYTRMLASELEKAAISDLIDFVRLVNFCRSA